MEASRISGDKQIVPSDAVKAELAKAGRLQLMVPVKLCLDRTGRITSITVMKSSGYPGYDADLVNGIATWRYRPFVVNGEPRPVCSAIAFIYKQN